MADTTSEIDRGSSALTDLRRARVSSLAQEQLRRQILRGVWPSGERLPSERQLASDLHVSRASIREAIRGLEAMGMVEVRHGQGVFVRPGTAGNTPSFAGWAHRHRYSISELLDFRLLVEPQVAALAARHCTDAFALELSALLDAMRAAAGQDDLAALVRQDMGFHDLIAERAGNRLYLDLLAHVHQLLEDSRRISLAVPGRPARVIAAHAAIADGIVARDGRRAAEAMRAHLTLFSHDMDITSEVVESSAI